MKDLFKSNIIKINKTVYGIPNVPNNSNIVIVDYVINIYSSITAFLKCTS